MKVSNSVMVNGFIHPSFLKDSNQWVENSATDEDYLAIVKEKREEADIPVTIHIMIESGGES
jgi:hypothetical protein